MSKDEGLAIFLAWLDALKDSLSENTTVVIPAIFAPFHMMQMNAKVDAHGIPQPSATVQPEMAADGKTPATTPPPVDPTSGKAIEKKGE
jgi:hypothetical protein